MRNPMVWIHWGNGELLVISPQGESLAKYAYPIEPGAEVSELEETVSKIPARFTTRLVSPMSSCSFVIAVTA